MSRGIVSLPEDQRAIEETIVGMRYVAEGNTRRHSPVRHCLRIHQCEDLIELCVQLKVVAEQQLVIKRDKQGDLSKLRKRQNQLHEDLDQVNSQMAEIEG